MKVLALFSLTNGAVIHEILESLHWHDVRLFRRLWGYLRRNDILVADRAFSDYVSLASLPQQAVDMICRLHQPRRPDFRPSQQRLGKQDACFTWIKHPEVASTPGSHVAQNPGGGSGSGSSWPTKTTRRETPSQAYPLLTRPRRQYKEIPHRNRYLKKSSPKSRGLI